MFKKYVTFLLFCFIFIQTVTAYALSAQDNSSIAKGIVKKIKVSDKQTIKVIEEIVFNVLSSAKPVCKSEFQSYFINKFGVKRGKSLFLKIMSKMYIISGEENVKEIILDTFKYDIVQGNILQYGLQFASDEEIKLLRESSNKSLKLKERYFKLKNVLMQFQKMYGNGYTMTPKDINKNLVYKKLFQKIGVNTVDQFINKKFWNGRIIDRLKRDGIYQRFCKLIDWYWQINGYDREKAKIQSLLHVAAEHNYNEYYNDLEDN